MESTKKPPEGDVGGSVMTKEEYEARIAALELENANLKVRALEAENAKLKAESKKNPTPVSPQIDVSGKK